MSDSKVGIIIIIAGHHSPIYIGQVKGDGEPSCFSNPQDTGIPDLQKWCHQLTISSRERAARNFLAHLKTFATSVQSYVQGIGDVTAIDRELLREKWESGNVERDEGLDHGYGAWASDPVDPFDAILGGLGGGLGAELYSLNKPAPKVDAYGQPVGVAPRLALVRCFPFLPFHIVLTLFYSHVGIREISRQMCARPSGQF